MQGFEVLDRLIRSGWGLTPQSKIPLAVMEAAEKGLHIPYKGSDREKFSDPTPDAVLQRRRDSDARRKRDKYGAKRAGAAPGTAAQGD